MKEQLENELKKWKESLNKELLRIKKEKNNCLSNNSDENIVLKRYWKKKGKILEKYNIESS